MAINISQQPSALIQALVGFGAGSGTAQRQNELIEQQWLQQGSQRLADQSAQTGRVIGQALLSRNQQQTSQGHFLDREMVRQTGLTFEEVQTLSRQAGLPVNEFIDEIRAKRAVREAMAEQESLMKSQGFMLGWRPDQLRKINELTVDAERVAMDEGLNGGEKMQELQNIAAERAAIRQGWVPDPNFPPPPPPDQIFKQSSHTDDEGRVWTVSMRNGAPSWDLKLDNTSQSIAAAKEIATQNNKLIELATKAAMEMGEDDSETFNEQKFNAVLRSYEKAIGRRITPVEETLGTSQGGEDVQAGGASLRTGDIEKARREIVTAAVGGDPAATATVIRAIVTAPPAEAKKLADSTLEMIKARYPASEVPPELLPLLKAIKKAQDAG